MGDLTAVLFDLDGTLTDRRQSLARFTDRFVAFYGNALQDGADVAGVIGATDRWGYAPRSAVARALTDRLVWRRPVGAAELTAFWRANFPESTVVRGGVFDTLRALRAAGVGLAVVSNGSADSQRRKLAAVGLTDLFDTLVFSAEVGRRKPEPGIFTLATDRLGVEAKNAWFVGDHPVYDVVGSRRAGMRTVWIEDGLSWPKNLLRPENRIVTFTELMPIFQSAGLFLRSTSCTGTGT